MEKLKPNNVWALGVVRTSLSGPKFQIMLDHMSCHGHAWMVSCFFNQIMSCHVMSCHVLYHVMLFGFQTCSCHVFKKSQHAHGGSCMLLVCK